MEKLEVAEVKKKLRDGTYTEEKPDGNSPAWTSFVVIVDEVGNKVGAAKCTDCDTVLKYDTAKTGTSTLLKHQRKACQKKKTSQLNMTHFLKITVPEKAKSGILEKCIKVCAKDMRPFRLFETPAFTELAQMLVDTGATHGKCNAKELLPSAVSVSRHTQTHCARIKAQLLPDIQKAISEAQACGAATDMWTDDHRKVSYTCITLHFIDQNWGFQSRVICTCAFPNQPKTGANIKNEIIKQLKDFGLTQEEIDKLVFVSDQAKNVQLALSSWTHHSCIAHVLNTVLKHTFKKAEDEDEEENQLEDVRLAMDECKSLTTFFKHSGLQLLLSRSLKQECETRWNTKFDMIDAVLSSYDDIMAILRTRNEWHRMRNTSKETLQMLVDFLKPFKKATEELSGSKYPTINLVPLWKSKLQQHCQPVASDPAALEVLKRRCLKLLGERIELGDHVKLGVMLSPKFKQLRMFSQQEREAVYNFARVEMSNFPPSEDAAPEEEEEEVMEASQATDQDELGGAFSQWEDVEETVPADSDELDQYLQLRSSPDTTDSKDYVLKFWEKNAKMFPKMARLVKKTLCVPATSVSCEAAFSMSGRTLENRRTHLGPASVNALLFLNSNM